MRTITIIDGPDDKPNRRRDVLPFCWAPTPGFALCLDVQSGQVLTIHVGKLIEGRRRELNAQNQIQEAAPAVANAS